MKYNDIKPGKRYAFRFKTSVCFKGKEDKYKGNIAGYVAKNAAEILNSRLYDFYAVNTAEAFAYILSDFLNGDPRSIQNGCRLETLATGPHKVMWCVICAKVVYGDQVVYADRPKCLACNTELDDLVSPLLMSDN